jgi:hypothetical protein
MQEFMNKEIIDNDDFNTHATYRTSINEDVYIICSKNTKVNYEVPMVKLMKS